ncbi:MAG: LemA family protein [Chitinophagaceae bacterium]|jgi:LemA protein
MKGTRNIMLLSVAAFVLILFVWGCSSYNKMASAETKIEGKWGQVEVQFNRKAKLYTDVVNAIKGAAKNEDTTLIKIVQMRSRIPDIKPDPNNPQQLGEVDRQYANLGKSILNINFENYPTLRTQEMFIGLQAQIEGTENRIGTAIKDWNDEVTSFNSNIVRFPKNMLASMFGFKKKANYKAPEGSNDVQVDFSK